MCTLTSIDQSQEACPNAIGGIFALALGDFADITASTISGTSVTALTGITWTKFIFDLDGTAFFDQNGEQVDQFTKKYVSDGFVKFVDLNDAKIAAVAELGCCNVVGIAFQNNGTNRIFGIDPNSAGDDVQLSLVPHKVVDSGKSGTTNESNRLEFVITGESSKMLSTTIDYDTAFP